MEDNLTALLLNFMIFLFSIETKIKKNPGIFQTFSPSHTQQERQVYDKLPGANLARVKTEETNSPGELSLQ